MKNRKRNAVFLAIVLLLGSVVVAYALTQVWGIGGLDRGTVAFTNLENVIGTPDSLDANCYIDWAGETCEVDIYFDGTYSSTGGVDWSMDCNRDPRIGTWGNIYLVFTDDTTYTAYTNNDPCDLDGRTGFTNPNNDKDIKAIRLWIYYDGTTFDLDVDAASITANVAATATPSVTATPTAIPSLTPTPTPDPCPLVDTGQLAVDAPEENYLIMGFGDEELLVTFVWAESDVALVFGAETFLCHPDMECDLKASERNVGESFWCYGAEGDCALGEFESRAFYCPGEYSLPEFDAEGVAGSGVVVTNIGESCIQATIDAFDLSDYPLLTIIADIFGLDVPAWGWLQSTWEVCLQKYEIESIEVGGYEFEPYVNAVLAMAVMLVIGIIIRR